MTTIDTSPLLARPITFFSVDVETSATVACTGSLLSVGIVPVVRDGTDWVMSFQQLYVRLSHDLSNEWEDPHYSSMPWWREQSDEARAEAYEDTGLVRHPPATAADMIAEFVQQQQPEFSLRIFTANPVSFDKQWIDALFAQHHLPPVFHYRSLCLRSMRFGMDPSQGYGSDRTTHPSTTPHHALADAQAQALDLIAMLSTRAEVG